MQLKSLVYTRFIFILLIFTKQTMACFSIGCGQEDSAVSNPLAEMFGIPDLQSLL